MFESIARLVNRRGLMLVVLWIGFAATLAATAPSWNSVTRDDDVNFFPPDYPSVIGQELLADGFPGDIASSSAVLISERPDGKLTPEDFAFVDRVAARMAQIAEKEPALGLKKVTTYKQPGIGAKLISTPKPGGGQAVLTLVALEGTYVSKQAREAVDRVMDELTQLRTKAPAGLRLEITGSAAVGHNINRASIESVGATTWATIILVIVILLAVYRSPLLALIPLATIALSVWTSLEAIALLTKVPGLNFQVINITNVFVIVVLFGAGTDYCLFLIARYREELARGRKGPEALTEAIEQTGGALVASAGTVIVGLGMLYFSTFAKISYTGPAIALSLVIALVASLTLAPVMLRWLRGAVFWPFSAPYHHKGADPEQEGLQETPMFGFWARVAEVVIRRPALILGLSLLAVLPLAYVGTQTRSSYDLLNDLNRDQPSVVGSLVVRKYFPEGELGPTSVLVDHPTLDYQSNAGVDAVERLSRALARVPNVAEVRAVSRPLGTTLPSVAARLDGAKSAPRPSLLNRLGVGPRATDFIIRAQADPLYVSTDIGGPDRGHITRINLVFKTTPFSFESLSTLEEVNKVLVEARRLGGPLHGAERIGLAGITTFVNDLRTVTHHDQQRMYVLVTLGVYLILVVLLRRPGICLYLIVTVVLGYLASLGLTELVFRWLHPGPEPWVGLDWKVGFFLFVILVAVGEDYNIFLMARVIEEEKKHGVIDGTRRAVAHTGGIISSCGLIMAGTFGAMLTGSMTALRELGFALGVGVLLDTFIVRPVLVPAFVVLLHRLRHPHRHDEAIRVPIPHENGRAKPVERVATGWSAGRFKDGWH